MKKSKCALNGLQEMQCKAASESCESTQEEVPSHQASSGRAAECAQINPADTLQRVGGSTDDRRCCSEGTLTTRQRAPRAARKWLSSTRRASWRLCSRRFNASHNRVPDSHLRITAVIARPMAIEEIVDREPSGWKIRN